MNSMSQTKQNEVAMRIREMRMISGYTEEEMARRTEVSIEAYKKLENGEIDFIIGTHRLLSKDVKFKDLGLLVLDEEQRFGVEHKEKLRVLKSNVDTLTMTATPIPRTLHMSLSGIRDISLINTPPTNRIMRGLPSEVQAAATRDPKSRDPVSPINILAG